MGEIDKSRRATVQLFRDIADAIEKYDYFTAAAMLDLFAMAARLARESGSAQLVQCVAVGGTAAFEAIRKEMGLKA